MAGATGSARAAGFYIGDPNARASGRAFSGEAADMGAASLFYNPASIAGITQSEITNSVTPILVDGRVSNSGSAITYGTGAPQPTGGAQNVFKPVELGVVPSGGFAYRINDQFSVGLAATSPFSFTTKYEPGDFFGRYSGVTTRLTTIDLQPSVAWRPFRWLGIGAGANIEYSNAVFTQALPGLGQGQPDGSLDLHANGYNAGWDVGAQLHPDDRLTLGVAYHSRIDHDLTGLYKITGLVLGNTTGVGAAGEGKFSTPWTLTYSVRYHLTDKLTVEGQGVRTGWSVFHQIDLISAGGVLPNQQENYHDTNTGSLGFDYDLTRRLTLRGGVEYDETPTSNGYRDVRVPDGDRFLFAGGFSFKATPHLVIDGAVNYIDFIPSHINQTMSPYANLLPGLLSVNTQAEVHANAETLSAGAHLYF